MMQRSKTPRIETGQTPEECLATLQHGIDSITDHAIFLLNPQGLVKTWNKGAERITGYTADEIIGQSFTRFYKPEVVERHYPAHVLEQAKAQEHFKEEDWHIRKDGAAFWADVVITPIYDEKGIHTGFMKVARDLTERKRAEFLLQQSEYNYRILADLSPVGIFHINSERKLIYANDRTYEIMGLSCEEVQQQGWLNAIHPEDRLRVAREWKNALEYNTPFCSEFRFLHKDNQTIWVLSITRPEEEADGYTVSYVQAIIDISERKLFEHLEAIKKAEQEQRQRAEELEENRKRLINYIDMFTHGLRNPLTGIQGTNLFIQRDIDNIQLALDEIAQNPLATKEKIAKYLSDIKEQTAAIAACAHHSIVITDDVLDLSRLEANSKKLIIEPFCVQTVLATIGKMFGAAMKEKELEFRLQIPEEELFVKGDPNCLEQVLTNLMTNAIKFTKVGYITLSVIQQETTPGEIVLQFKVKDTGIGITEEEKQRIFNRFEQGHKVVRHNYGGSGLGLHISKQLVKLMGGEISVETEAGKGSIFTFTIRCLPLSKEEQQQLIQPMPKEEKNEMVSVEVGVSRNILIVEDNVINQRILARQLKSKGYQYQVANNGLEALEKWQATGFDAILMDIEMPKMNGLEATKEIRQQEKLLNQSLTPIIGLSGNARQEQKEEAFGAGMNAYLIKPYEPEKIYQAVEDSLNRHSLKQTEQQSAFFDAQRKSPSLHC